MLQEITLSTCAFTADPADEAELIKYFNMAMDAGFSGFELAIVPDDCAAILHRAARKSGAKIIAVHGILDGNSCSPDPELRKKSVQRASSYLAEFAEYAPCPVIEHYHSRFNAPEYGDYFRDSVSMLLKHTDDLNFTFCMENAPYKPEYDERFPNVAEIVDFVRSFGDNRMFMTFDLNHANLHEDILTVCQTSAGVVRHIHVSDNHGIREEHLLPGTGIIDFSAVLTALYANGYSGPCNLEVGFPRNCKAAAEDYRKLYQYMRAIRVNGK